MTFDMIYAGDRVFVDANIFLYHFGEASAECKTFLTRCSHQEILGYTSTSVLAEVLHRAMLIEAVKKGYITAKIRCSSLKNILTLSPNFHSISTMLTTYSRWKSPSLR